MRHLLILTAAYGEGHNAAARGLQEGLTHQPTVSAKVWDPLAVAFGRFYDFSRRNYLQTIEQRPGLWAATYRLLDRTPLIRLAEWTLFKVRRLLRQELQDSPPAAIVSVYPLYPYLLEHICPPGPERRFKLFTVVTDSITINSVWHRCTSDLFFVPNEDSAEAMRSAGVPAGRIRVLGFPVTPVFALSSVHRPEPARGAARVLFMINAGRRRSVEVVEHLLRLEGVRLTITVGRDEQLGETLRQMVNRSGKKAEILGWVPNMPELVMSHHVLIGKAGGAAVQEAIAACTPMVITHVVPGQEEGNALLLQKHGCGAVCETPEAIAAQVQALFAKDGQLWRQWHAEIAKLSRPDAALRLAEAIVAELS